MSYFDEMLDRYGLSHDIFGLSPVATLALRDTPVASNSQPILAAPDETPAPDTQAEATTVPLEIENAPVVDPAPEHDPSLPPWGRDEDDDLLAGIPDLIAGAAEGIF